MKIGDRYNWKNQPERLVYVGMCEPRNGRWYQFEKVDEPGVVRRRAGSGATGGAGSGGVKQ